MEMHNIYRATYPTVSLILAIVMMVTLLSFILISIPRIDRKIEDLEASRTAMMEILICQEFRNQASNRNIELPPGFTPDITDDEKCLTGYTGEL